MSARFATIQTAREQFHSQFFAANGVEVWWTENYKRLAGADNAIDSVVTGVARMLAAELRAYADDVFYRDDSPFHLNSKHSYHAAADMLDAFTVPRDHVDDRLKPMPRPELPTVGAS